MGMWGGLLFASAHTSVEIFRPTRLIPIIGLFSYLLAVALSYGLTPA